MGGDRSQEWSGGDRLGGRRAIAGRSGVQGGTRTILWHKINMGSCGNMLLACGDARKGKNGRGLDIVATDCGRR